MKSFLCSLLVCVSLYASGQSFREQFTEANLLTEDGYYGIAIPIWENLLKEKPDNANLHYKLGLSYLNLGIDREKALPYLKKASKDVERIYDPFSSDFKGAPVEAYYYLGKAFHLTNELDSAVHYYEEFLSEAGKKHYLRPDAEKGIEMCANAKEFMANPVDVTITNIGTPINSPFAEYAPIVAFDENALYYTSRRLRPDESNKDDIEASTGLYFEDMYVSFRNLKGSWMEPELLNINLPNAHSSVVSMSQDGRHLYTYKTYSGDGNIYVSDFEIGTGWTPPVLVGSDVNTKYNEFFATITADGQRLYFVSDRPGGLGGKDIWYCNKLPNGEWGKSINLGAPINTSFDEDAPFIHPDGKTMFFSSNGHKSMGGYDIFRTQYTESGWSAPLNLGYPINTTDDDHSYITSPSGERAYYSSKNANTLGSTDIYVVEYPKEEKAPQVDLSAFAVLKGWVLTPQSSVPDNFTIYVTNKQTGELQGEATPVARNGSFVFIIPSGNTYHVEYTLGGDVLVAETIVIPPGQTYQELSREVIISADKTGSMEAVVLDEKVLNPDKSWQVVTQESSGLIPVGSKVYYLDINENILHTAYVSKDGFFEFKKLNGDVPIILKFEADGFDQADLDIVLRNKKDGEIIDLTHFQDKFIEQSQVPKNKTKTTPDIQQKDVAKSIKNNTSKSKLNATTIASDNKAFIFKLGYNQTSIESDHQFNALIDAISSSIKAKGQVSISVEGSASKVPTSSFSSNQELAEKRARDAVSEIQKTLASRDLDTNKISTKSISGIVQGPEYDSSTRGKQHLFSDFQYVKIVLN